MTSRPIPIVDCPVQHGRVPRELVERSPGDRLTKPRLFRLGKSNLPECHNYLRHRLERAGHPDGVDVHRKASVRVTRAAVPPAYRAPVCGVDAWRANEILHCWFTSIRCGELRHERELPQ